MYLYVIALLCLIFLLAVLWMVRKSVMEWMQGDAPAGPGFTLSDLRQLHKTGAMSDEEFDRAKAMVVQGIQRAAEREAQAKAKPQRPPGLHPGQGPDREPPQREPR